MQRPRDTTQCWKKAWNGCSGCWFGCHVYVWKPECQKCIWGDTFWFSLLTVEDFHLWNKSSVWHGAWAWGQAQQTTTGRARGTFPADMNTCNSCEGFLCCCPITSILEKQSASEGHGDTVTNLPGNPQLPSLPFPIHPAVLRSSFYPPQTPDFTALGKATDSRCQFLSNYKHSQRPKQLTQPRHGSCNHRDLRRYTALENKPCGMWKTHRKSYFLLKKTHFTMLDLPTCKHRGCSESLMYHSITNSNSPAFPPH